MRFDSNIKFYSDSEEHYDPVVGDYVGGVKLVGEEIANVTEVGTDRSRLIFGDITTKAIIIRFANDIDYKWAYLTIDGSDKQYVIDTSRQQLKGYSLIVGERK